MSCDIATFSSCPAKPQMQHPCGLVMGPVFEWTLASRVVSQGSTCTPAVPNAACTQKKTSISMYELAFMGKCIDILCMTNMSRQHIHLAVFCCACSQVRSAWSLRACFPWAGSPDILCLVPSQTLIGLFPLAYLLLACINITFLQPPFLACPNASLAAVKNQLSVSVG